MTVFPHTFALKPTVRRQVLIENAVEIDVFVERPVRLCEVLQAVTSISKDQNKPSNSSGADVRLERLRDEPRERLHRRLLTTSPRRPVVLLINRSLICFPSLQKHFRDRKRETQQTFFAAFIKAFVKFESVVIASSNCLNSHL